MKIITESNQIERTELVAGIGFFDGVHQGHKYLINNIITCARIENRASSVITFREHPRKILNKHSDFCLLNSLQEKLDYLAATKVEYCILLDFTEKMSLLSAEQFLKYLYTDFNVRSLVIGYDHRFGRDRAEGFEQYVIYGKRLGMEIVQSTQYAPKETRISSSVIRKLISEDGNVSEAMNLLSYPYSLKGCVIKGRQVGRKLGFPTANLKPENEKVIPRPGVYVVQVKTDDGNIYNGMLNFGKRPTLKNGDDYTIEVHIFNYDGDLYNRNIEVFFLHFMRPEMRFASLDELKEQLRKDKEQAKSLLSS